MLCAVSYTVAGDEWIFFLSIMDFFLCVMVYTVQLSDPWCYLQTPCAWADYFLSAVDFFLSFTSGHL